MKRTPGYRRYLDPTVLARIGGLELRARLAVEGFVSGHHTSPHHGASVEFADHRSYAQGDDIRHIDWKVFARTDKYYIKEFEADTNLQCVMVLDNTASMGYRSTSAPMSKADYASCVTATLSYLALQQRDAVGLVRFGPDGVQQIRPSGHPAHWKTLVDALNTSVADHETRTDSSHVFAGDGEPLATVLNHLAETLNRRSMVIVISDFLVDLDKTSHALKHLRYYKNDVIAFDIWDPAERSFPFSGPTMFEGLENSRRMMTEPATIRSQYLAEVRAFIESLRENCRRLQIDYSLFDTSMGLDGAISRFLATRASQLRHRASRVVW
jgi:uncharacterized protein (DUF58 family)